MPLLPPKFWILHPVRAYKATKALNNLRAATTRITTAANEGRIKTTDDLVELQVSILKDIRKGTNRPLTPKEMELYNTLTISANAIKRFDTMWDELTPPELRDPEFTEGLKTIFWGSLSSGKTPEEHRRLTEEFVKNYESKKAAASVIATQAPASKERVKTPVSQYKPVVKGLKKSLTDQLNKRPWSEARNELIYKIEMMDELNLSQLYYENKELFAIYYYGDSPEYVEEYDSDRFVYGYNDVVIEYERRFGVIL